MIEPSETSESMRFMPPPAEGVGMGYLPLLSPIDGATFATTRSVL
jgi:hypothetical protein